jgi:hypothetical protein
VPPKSGKPRFFAQEIPKTTENKFVPKEVGFYNRYPEFSFKHYEHTHRKYSVQCITNLKDFHVMFEKLKSMSQLKWKEIKIASHMYHFHPIEWEETSEPKGFKNLPAELIESPAWQFKLFKECRAVGFFNQDNIFELVWIDKEHKIYSCR